MEICVVKNPEQRLGHGPGSDNTGPITHPTVVLARMLEVGKVVLVVLSAGRSHPRE